MGLFKAWLNEMRVDCPNGIFAKVIPTTDSVVAIKNRFAHYGDKLMEDLHATAIYSKTPANSVDLPIIDRKERYKAVSHGVEWWEGHDKEGYLVLKLSSPSLTRLNKKFQDAGLKGTYKDYNPHVTLMNPCPTKPNSLAQDIEELQNNPLSLEFYYGGYVLLDKKE